MSDSTAATRWLAALGLAALGGGAVLTWRWPASAPALECSPEQVRWVDAGTGVVAVCARRGGPGPAAERLTLGLRLDLNRASEAELSLLSGVGPSLARAISHARGDGGFRSWDDVDAVPGIGASKLEVLRTQATLGPLEGGDGGVL